MDTVVVVMNTYERSEAQTRYKSATLVTSDLAELKQGYYMRGRTAYSDISWGEQRGALPPGHELLNQRESFVSRLRSWNLSEEVTETVISDVDRLTYAQFSLGVLVSQQNLTSNSGLVEAIRGLRLTAAEIEASILDVVFDQVLSGHVNGGRQVLCRSPSCSPPGGPVRHGQRGPVIGDVEAPEPGDHHVAGRQQRPIPLHAGSP